MCINFQVFPPPMSLQTNWPSAALGIFGAHLMWVGIWLEHEDGEEGENFEVLGAHFQTCGNQMRNACLQNCGWQAPMPDF